MSTKPFVKIHHIPTDDIRDKLIKSFLENLTADNIVLEYNYPKQDVFVGDDPEKILLIKFGS